MVCGRCTTNLLGPISATESKVLLESMIKAAGNSALHPDLVAGSDLKLRGLWTTYVNKFNNQFSSLQAQHAFKHSYDSSFLIFVLERKWC